jgi:YD repeat-containing protein
MPLLTLWSSAPSWLRANHRRSPTLRGSSFNAACALTARRSSARADIGYDTENRLVSASGGKNGSLKYDPLGRLVEFTTPAPTATTTRFVYDGDRLIAEYNGSETLLRRYVHGAGVDEPLLWYEGNVVSAAKRQYLHADHQGSIIAMSKNTGACGANHLVSA